MRSSSLIVLNGSVKYVTPFQVHFGRNNKRVNNFNKGE